MKTYIAIFIGLLIATISYATPIAVNAGFRGQNITDKVFVWVSADKNMPPETALQNLRQQR